MPSNRVALIMSSMGLSAAVLCLGLVVLRPAAVQAQDHPERPALTADDRAALRQADALSRAFNIAAEQIAPSVVNITAIERVTRREVDRSRRRTFGDLFNRGNDEDDNEGGDTPNNDDEDNSQLGRRVRVGEGSGIIMRHDGYILTNNHVVGDAVEIFVRVHGEGPSAGRYQAELVGADADTDLAVIKIDAENLVPARFADSDAIIVGEWILAVGNPFGFESTVTSGIVSARGRSRISRQTYYSNFIQTDAAINPGNSGGPLVNLRGEVIGINYAITTEDGRSIGVGFAIPGNMAHSVANSLIDHGRVIFGWLGVSMGPVATGVLVSYVTENGPAEAAGIRRNDIITALDGEPITNSSLFQNTIARSTPGTTYDFTVLRDGEQSVVRVQLAERPPLEVIQRR